MASEFNISIDGLDIYFGSRKIGKLNEETNFSERERFKDFVASIPECNEVGEFSRKRPETNGQLSCLADK